ncbi:MAG: MFS transporter [Steroidobacteraceae bacterium]
MPLNRLIVLIAGNFFVATSFLSVGGLLPDIAASLAIPIEQAGLLIAAFGISAAICAPTLATLGSRIDRRVLLTGSMAICALANVLAAFSRDYDELDARGEGGGKGERVGLKPDLQRSRRSGCNPHLHPPVSASIWIASCTSILKP